MSTTSLKTLIAAFAFGAVALAGSVPAMAHDGWGGDGWGHEGWREHRWHERMWMEHHQQPIVMVPAYPGYQPAYPPQVVYVPQPVYRQPPPPSVTFVIPLR